MLSLSQRQQKVLLCVIEHFNATGEPVPSSVVARNQELNVSSATIRNVMSELEELGLLNQPHTSAGRMPTAIGMRYYVNHLHRGPGLQRGDDQELTRQFVALRDDDLEVKARSTGVLLSQLSQLASIVSLPSVSQSRLQEVRFTPLTERRVLVILMTEDGRIFNRVVRVDEEIDEMTLARMQNYLCELVAGMTLRQVRARVSQELAAIETRYQNHITQALRVGQLALEAAPQAQLYVEGTLNILEFTEIMHDVDRVRELLRGLQDKERVVDILDRICDARRPQALIGPELGWDLGNDLSFIACGYYRCDHQIGVLGILGPIRMDYARIIPLVEHAARMLSKDTNDDA
ncbi:MAG: heat-inducible transcription repressor HrcA [Bradymonadaceae bacterium]|nr:heat-inducible transcription repressor HrcA [Lujinxingiaceae bacterium]